jgi:hypothetical protein
LSANAASPTPAPKGKCEPASVFGTDASGRMRFLDVSASQKWGPITTTEFDNNPPSIGLATLTGVVYPTFEPRKITIKSTLYRKHDGWVLVNEKPTGTHFEALTDQDAVDWLRLNGLKMPADLAHLPFQFFDMQGAGTGTGKVAAGPKPAAPAADCIISHGNMQYSIAGGPPIVVSENDDTLLQAFLEQPAMNKPQLGEKTGLGDVEAVKVINKLPSRYNGMFASAITLPKGRNKGGYRVKIQHAAKTDR